MIRKTNKILTFIFLFSLTTLSSYSQLSSDSLPPTHKNKYLKFLLESDSTSIKYYTVSARYIQTAVSPSFKSKGIYVNAGLNLGRLFSKKIFFGPTLDLKLLQGPFNVQRFSDNFKTDFNNSFHTKYNSIDDSTLAYKIKNEINNGSFNGNTFGNIGVTLSLFPQKYGGIFISFKTGLKSFRTPGGTWQSIPNDVKEHYYLTMDKNYSVEISVKPFIAANRSFFIISFYYERLNLKDATYEKMKLSDMVDSSFMSKYGISDTYGLTIGYGF